MGIEKTLKNVLPHVDEKISTLVEGLIRIGAPTCWSCQGHLDATKLPYPKVSMCIDPTDEDPPSRGWLEVLAVLIAEWESTADCTYPWHMLFHAGPWSISVTLEPWDQNLRRSPVKLSKFQEEAESLGRFLSEKREEVTERWGLSV